MEGTNVFLCTKCGKRPAMEGRRRCTHCTEIIRQHNAIKREERETKGLCVKCGKASADPGMKFCSVCRKKQNERSSRDRAFVKENNLCIKCRKEKTEPGIAYCLSCKMDERERGRNRLKEYTEDERKTINRKSGASHRALRAARKENGLCIVCGKRKSAEGRLSCVYCLERKKKQYRRRRDVKGNIPVFMRGNGVYCACCLKPVEREGDKVCKRCAEHLLCMSLGNIGRQIPDDHPWRKDEKAAYYEHVRRRKQNEDGNRGQEIDQRKTAGIL